MDPKLVPDRLLVGVRSLTVFVLIVGNVASTGGVEQREHCLDIFLGEKRGLRTVVGRQQRQHQPQVGGMLIYLSSGKRSGCGVQMT